MYKSNRNYENLQKAIYDGAGEYDIPSIIATQFDVCEFVGFNYAMACQDKSEKAVHFFLDDYQFERVWNSVDRYIPILKQFKYVLTPDFSLFTDFPKVLQIYNHYRKHWLGAYMQDHGINVIPTIGWSDESSYDWCFDGEPENGCVAVSSVGCLQNSKSKELFIAGYNEMIRRLNPSQIIFYGTVPDECEGNIIRIDSFVEKFRKGNQDGRKRCE